MSDIVYESDRVTVVCGDAREVLPTFARESADCVVTDPPYGAAWQSGWRRGAFAPMAGDATVEAARTLLGEVAPSLVRATRPSRHVYAFGAPIEHELLAAKAELVWDKGQLGSGDLSRVWGPSHEPIFFHVRVSGPCDVARGRGGLSARLRRGSVLRVPRLNGTQVRRHPTEKPVALLRQLVESSTQMDEVVLDPFAGCGSTGVAAIVEGRRALLVEVDPGYAEVAADRCRAAEAAVQALEEVA